MKLRLQWSPEECQEHDDLMWKIVEDNPRSQDRILAVVKAVESKTRTRWAKEVKAQWTRMGAGAYIRRFVVESDHWAVAHNGDIVIKPTRAGVKKVDANGNVFDQLKLFRVMTWEELEGVKSDRLKTLRAYSADVSECDRLLAMRELAPTAANPEEAAKVMGTTVEEWLATG